MLFRSNLPQMRRIPNGPFRDRCRAGSLLNSSSEANGVNEIAMQAPVQSLVPDISRKSLTQRISVWRSAWYAAPAAGSWFYYIPMWSILPGIYAKYFGLKLTSIAAVILFIRLFDGVIDTAIGYLSDWRRAHGGSRKTWVIAGDIGVIFACYKLFLPPPVVTTAYYLTWSIAFFLAFTIAEIPHVTWGAELTMEYQERSKVFAVRNIVCRIGVIAFYSLPLLPISPTGEYTPQVLRNAVYIGAFMTSLGLGLAMMGAPAGIAAAKPGGDSMRLLVRSILKNKPLLIFFMASALLGLAVGMWFALVYFYLDSYMHLGSKIPTLFLIGYGVSILCTPLWLEVIRRTSKATAWVTGIVLFIAQLAMATVLTPTSPSWMVFALVIAANIYFCCNDIAAVSIVGDIVDYGRLTFGRDRGATYFAVNTLVFKFGLGIGGGIGLGVAGLFGFDPTATTQSGMAVVGLKVGFAGLPTVLTIFGLIFVLLTPINRRRHGIIQKRIESRLPDARLKDKYT